MISYTQLNSEKVFAIDNRRFREVMKIVEPVEQLSTFAAWDLRCEIARDEWEELEHFAPKGVQCGDEAWAQTASIYKWMDGVHILEVRMTYFGKGKGKNDDELTPKYYTVPEHKYTNI